MTRKEFIKTGSAATAAGFAGCMTASAGANKLALLGGTLHLGIYSVKRWPLTVVKSILMVAGVLFFLMFASVLLDTPGARRFGSYRSYPDLKTSLAVEKDDIAATFCHEREDTNFTFVVLKPCRFLASGPAVLVYDSEGNLFDKSLDEGDDSRFQREWGEWRRSWPDSP